MEHVVFIIILALISSSTYALILLWQKYVIRREVPFEPSQEIQPGDQLYIKRQMILDDLIHGGLVTVDTVEFSCVNLAGINNHRFPLSSPLFANQKKLAMKYGLKKAKLTPAKFLFF